MSETKTTKQQGMLTGAAAGSAVATNDAKKLVRPIDNLKFVLSKDSIKEQFANALKDGSALFVASIIDLYNGDKRRSIHDAGHEWRTGSGTSTSTRGTDINAAGKAGGADRSG